MPRGIWDLPGPRIEPKSPAVAGGFFTPEPSGKPDPRHFKNTCLILIPASFCPFLVSLNLLSLWFFSFCCCFHFYWHMIAFDVMLVSTVQQSKSTIYIYPLFFGSFSHSLPIFLLQFKGVPHFLTSEITPWKANRVISHLLFQAHRVLLSRIRSPPQPPP